MKNASSHPTVAAGPAYPQGPDERTVHQLLFNAVDYIPLVVTPLEDPPPGQVRLVEPVPLPSEIEEANWLQKELQRRRVLFEEALAGGDERVELQQACEFAGLTHRLLWQRFRLPDFRHEKDTVEWMVGYLSLSPETAEELRGRRQRVEEALASGDPGDQAAQIQEFEEFRGRLLQRGPRQLHFRRQFAAVWWLERFLEPSVVRRACELHERHDDALIVLDLPAGEFQLSPPQARGRRMADKLVASLRPVFDALALKGLWVGNDRQFQELARVLIGLARTKSNAGGREERKR